MSKSPELSAQAKLLVIVDYLSKDRIITYNAQSLLKDLILSSDPTLLSLLPIVSTSGTEAAFIDAIYSVIDTRTESVFNELFEECSIEVAKQASKGERAEKELTKERSLIYGEVEFASFNAVLRKICTNLPPGGNFYDIGSGSGRAVMAARLTQDFNKCVGIELMENLSGLADMVKEKFDRSFQHVLHTGYDCNDVSLYCADFLAFDWTDGDVIFANSTCFTDTLMNSIAEVAGGMKPGSFLVTFTKGINSENFELVEKKRYNMSWGPATVFVHRRLMPDGRSAGPAVLQSYGTSPPQNLSYPGQNQAPVETGPLEVQGTAVKLNFPEPVEEEEDEEGDYIGEDDVDSGFYSGAESSKAFTPSTSVNASFDSSVNTQTTDGSGVESSYTPNTSYNYDTVRPPALDMEGAVPVAPLSPGMRRIYAEEQLGVMTSPKDTMLMQRKRMRGKKANENGGSKLFG